jgi:hypothetical protein
MITKIARKAIKKIKNVVFKQKYQLHDWHLEHDS